MRGGDNKALFASAENETPTTAADLQMAFFAFASFIVTMLPTLACPAQTQTLASGRCLSHRPFASGDVRFPHAAITVTRRPPPPFVAMMRDGGR